MIGNEGIVYKSGTWGERWRIKFSNFQEVDNPVTKIEALVESGDIKGHKVFMFTNNSSFKSNYYQGTPPCESFPVSSSVYIRLFVTVIWYSMKFM